MAKQNHITINNNAPEQEHKPTRTKGAGTDADSESFHSTHS
jgi:hypothetical protein